MTAGPELLLIAAVFTVGVLHTIVPDHWVPIVLLARQRQWSKAETARVALQAGAGHVLSTLVIALAVWLAGVAAATRFGNAVDTAASLALVAFGGWIALSSWHELAAHGEHGHSHGATLGGIHGPEMQRLPTPRGVLELSIYESVVPPRFRLTGARAESVKLETRRPDGARQVFLFADHGTYWESVEEIPEPHGFEVRLTLAQDGRAQDFATRFSEHDHDHDHGHHHGQSDAREPAADPLYAPLSGDVGVLTRHAHRDSHGRGAAHVHWHDHIAATAHPVTAALELAPPLHRHRHKTTARTALLLILGSSPMVEGIPAFFAAGKYGIGVIAAMAAGFALATIATYVLLCVISTAGLQRVRLGAVERYGEVLSGAFIALVGLVFWVWPVL
jgi:hypothetical protein